MQAVEVKIKGFSAFLAQAELSLQQRGLVLLEGLNHDSTSAKSNGSGKTSILKAITWCLFGEYVDGDRTVEVIHKKAKRAEVSTLWIDEETETAYNVTRSQTKSGQSLHVEMTSGDAWVSIDGKNKKDTQAKIEAIFGINYQTWCNTILYAAGDLTRFAARTTDDAERKRMFKQIYGLGVFDTAREVIAESSRSVRGKLDEAERAVMRRKTQIETLNVKGLEANVSTAEIGRAAELKRKDQVILNLEQTIERLRREAERAEVQRELMVRHSSRLDEITVKLAELDREIEAGREALVDADGDRTREKVGQLISQLNDVRRQENRLVGDRCPICRSSFTELGDARSYKEELAREDRELSLQVDRLSSVLAERDAELSKRRAVVKLKMGELQQLSSEATRLRSEMREAERFVASLATVEQQISGLKANIEANRQERERVRVAPNPYAGLLAEEKTKQAKWSLLLKGEEQVVAEHRENLAYFDFWREAFSDRGLISFVIDQVLPLLNRRTNEKLQVLSDGDIVVLFDSESALRSGELRDRIGMRTMIEGLNDVTPSTAQEKKISLSTALALMDIVSSRQNKKIDLQLLDEPFDGLDEIGKQRAVDLLQQQGESKATILVTTHDPTVAGVFTRRILVERKNGEAKLVE
jgi:DNA repair exonuclease SbcCD ATPase subunit